MQSLLLDLPSELQFEILLFLTLSDLFNLAQCNHYLAALLYSDSFWTKKVKFTYNYCTLPSLSSWKTFYQLLVDCQIINLPVFFNAHLIGNIWILFSDSLLGITYTCLKLLNCVPIASLGLNFIIKHYLNSERELIFIQTTNLGSLPIFNISFASNKRLINTELSETIRINITYLVKLEFGEISQNPLSIIPLNHLNKIVSKII